MILSYCTIHCVRIWLILIHVTVTDTCRPAPGCTCRREVITWTNFSVASLALATAPRTSQRRGAHSSGLKKELPTWKRSFIYIYIEHPWTSKLLTSGVSHLKRWSGDKGCLWLMTIKPRWPVEHVGPWLLHYGALKLLPEKHRVFDG